MQMLGIIWLTIFLLNNVYATNIYSKYDNACNLLNQGKYFQAADSLKSIISEFPDFAQSYEKLANVYLELNALNKGIQYFDSLAENGRKDLAIFCKALIFQAQNKYLPAINLLSQSVEEGCAHSRLYFALGELFVLAEKINEGVTFFYNLPERKCAAAMRYCGLGALYRQIGNPAEAKRMFEHAISFDPTLDLALRNLAWINLRSDPNKAKELYDQWRLVAAKTSENLGYYYYIMGQYWFVLKGDAGQGKASFRESLRFAQATHDSYWIGRNYSFLGRIDEGKGRRQSAKHYYELALKNIPKNSSPYLATQIYLADILSTQGDFRTAMNLYLLAIASANDLNMPRRKYLAMLNMGIMHLKLSNFDKALSYLKQCEKYYLDQNDMNLLPHALNGLGIVSSEQKNYEQALAYYERALEIGKKEGIVSLLLSKAETQIRLGKYDQVANTLDEATELVPVHGVDIELTEIDRLRGLLYEESGKFERALEFYKNAYHKESGPKRPYLFIPILEGLARVSEKMSENELALNWLQEAINVIDTVRIEIGVTEIKQKYLSSRINIYDRMITTQLSLNKPEAQHEAFKYTEKAKGQSLKDLFAQAAALNASDANLVEIEENDFLIEENHRKILELKKDLGKEDEIIRLEQENLALDLKNESLKNKQNTAEQPGMDYSYISLDNVQKSLESNQAVLEYKVTENQLVLFLIKSDDFFVKTQSITRDSLTALISNVLQKIKDQKSTPHDLNHLYKFLVEPFEEQLAMGDELIIIPDEALFYLPFESLVTNFDEAEAKGDFKNSDFLIERNSIVYYPAASLINKAVPRQKRPKHNFLALANSVFPDPSLRPLIFARKEVSDIANLISGKNSVLLLDKEAIKSRYKQEVGQYKVEHIASHILIDDNQPMYSKISMTQDGSDTNHDLFAYEVLNMRTNADLVVLSGCNSALGKLLPGEGIIGMSQSFMTAGAQSILMSLWPVDDRLTSEFMFKFYQNLASGLAKHEALREAKIAMLKDGVVDPFFWAPFILTGKTEPIDFSSHAKLDFALSSLLGVIFIAFLIQRYRKNSIPNKHRRAIPQ